MNDIEVLEEMRDKDVSEIVKEIRETGKVNRGQYRVITGACQFGTEQYRRFRGNRIR